ncbi:MAG: CoA ester lyase [Sphingomonadaceae bacterium]|nr:CoA ester lyase [Sphingomonadaceae bacterium]
MIRSWLFAPATNDKKLAKLGTVGAHAVVLDLVEGVAADAKADARQKAQDWLKSHSEQVISQRRYQRWVRINPLDTPHWRDDLVAVMQGGPQGIILPKASSPQDVQMIAAEIYELEQRNRLEHGSTAIMPQVGDTPAAALRIASFAEDLHPRVSGLIWNAPALARALDATRLRDENGQWTLAMQQVRAMTLLTARAKGLMAVDTVPAGNSETDGLEWSTGAARADGFSGMQAVNPKQVRVINRSFAATREELGDAREIVALFASNPSAETVTLRDRTVEKRQLQQARILLQWEGE